MKIYLDFKNVFVQHFRDYSLFLEIEKNKWEVVTDIEQADIIALPISQQTSFKMLKRLIKPHQILLVLEIYHITEFMDDGLWIEGFSLRNYKNISDKIIYVHKNLKNKNPKYIHFDHMWNRQKLYFTEYEKIPLPKFRCWTKDCNPDIYRLNEIVKDKSKKFLSPMRVIEGSHQRHVIRAKLRKFLEDYEHQGYISRPEQGQTFSTNNDKYIDTHLAQNGGTWYPLADYYYNSSYISIYTETICQTLSSEIVTEKTFDPLIKGNFILPFGHQYILQRIRDYGFKLPDWIDYSYDQEFNDEVRFDMYLESCRKVLQKSVDELHELYLNDRHILEHNRNIFFSRPYESLYEKVKDYVTVNNLIGP